MCYFRSLCEIRSENSRLLDANSGPAGTLDSSRLSRCARFIIPQETVQRIEDPHQKGARVV